MKLGEKLTELRRKKGLTQEQLAALVGVSTPAVSKWENDHSYPDITLLCPLARALDTNVDTLLQFEEELSEQDVVEQVEKVLEIAKTDGYAAAEHTLGTLLHQYPNSVALQFHAAVVYDSFYLFFPEIEQAVRDEWRAEKKKLLRMVRASGVAAYWQTATVQLASIAIAEGELEQAEQLLDELPEDRADSTACRSLLYHKQGNTAGAQILVQKRLYSAVQQVQRCLTILMGADITPDVQHALRICEVYRAVDELFGCGGMNDGMFLELFVRMGDWERAAQHLASFVDALCGDAVLPKRFLFEPGLQCRQERPASGAPLRRMLLQSLEEEQYAPLRALEQGQAAIQRLRDSLSE